MHSIGQRTDPDDASTRTIRIAYVGGGSSNWAVTFINDLAQSPVLDGEVSLYDIDVENARKNAELGNQVQSRAEAESGLAYAVSDSLEGALEGADFVVLSTQDPPPETYAHDLNIPRQYRLFQTVGDTVGPGGIFRGMRTVPFYREIATTIRDRCPDAWVLNYTNPMSICTRTLYAEYPGINAIGLCHGVFGTQRLLASLVGEHREVETPPMESIDVTVSGINHCTWCTEAYWRGHDLFELLDEELAAHGPPADPHEEGTILSENRIEFDMYETYGAFPAISGRHLAEFSTWYLAVDDPAKIRRWGISLNESEEWLKHWQERGSRRDRYYEDPGTFEFRESGEVGVDIIEALLGAGAVKTNVNFPNRGQSPDLPQGAVVETNALVTANKVAPLVAGELPRDVRAIVSRHVCNQEGIVEAGFDGDVDGAFGVFLNDPLVSTISKADARELFSDLVAAERDYLDAWDLDGASVLS